MRIHPLIISLLLALQMLFTAAMAGAAPANVHPEYTLTVIGPANSYAAAINDAGVVVGSYEVNATSFHAFLNRGAGLVDLGALGGTSSAARVINNRGEVLGNWRDANGVWRGFIYHLGATRDLGAIPGRDMEFVDINDAGYVIANGFSNVDLPTAVSYLRPPAGKFQAIGALPFENPVTNAQALNNRNQITGTSGPLLLPDIPLRGFIWTQGAMRNLGELGSLPVGGLAINDRGQVTGYASVPGFHTTVAFLYAHGRMVDIDGRPTDADRHSEGRGINNRGHVVGTSDHLSGFIYRGRRMESLNALVAPGSGWDIRTPVAINEAGQIAATAYRNQVEYAVRLDLIRPLPAPSPLDADDADAPQLAQPLTPEAAAAEQRANAAAQAAERVQPVRQ